MKKLNSAFITTLILLLGFSVNASAEVRAEGAWVRGTVSQQKATGAFMTLQSSKATQLISASSPSADVVEVHEMIMEGNMMKMRALPALNIPANAPVQLKPGSYHIMLMNLKKPLKEGESVAISLNFIDADKLKHTVDVLAPVRAMTMQHHDMH
jgi:periplasmic copper chaperone A